MPRPDVTPAFAAALMAPVLYPAIMVRCDFSTGPIYLWSGAGPLVWAGLPLTLAAGPPPIAAITFAGAGDLLSVSAIEEGADVTARGISMTLSGINPALVADALTEFQVGLTAQVWLGLFSNTSGNLIAQPITTFKGRTDSPIVEFDANTASITIACESILLDLNNPTPYRYTSQDQQRFYPNDMGFTFVPSIQNIPIYWGNANGAASGQP